MTRPPQQPDSPHQEFQEINSNEGIQELGSVASKIVTIHSTLTLVNTADNFVDIFPTLEELAAEITSFCEKYKPRRAIQFHLDDAGELLHRARTADSADDAIANVLLVGINIQKAQTQYWLDQTTAQQKAAAIKRMAARET